MSLLLEALKKAEKAKEEAQRRAGADGAPSPAAAPAAAPIRQELSLQHEAAAEPKPVMTRSQLPDIHQPLEILSDDIAPAAPEPRPTPASSSRPGAPARPREEPAPEAARAGARKVFEVKFKEANPRLPFYITIGVLGAFAVGTGVYFWYQLRPPQALVNPNPTPSTVAAVPAQPASPGTPASAAPAPSVTTSGIPGLPGVAAAPATAPVQAPIPPAQPRGPKPSAIPADPPPPSARAIRPAVAASKAPAAAEPAQQLNISRPVPQINPQVEIAYAAFMSGDIASARTAYEAAVRDDPSNRDALLGLAAVDVRTGRLDAAEAAYVRLLRADPRDAHAQAGLLGLRSARVDPLAAETRVKGLLAGDPGAHVLNFALANQLAQQGRWPEAQQQYFKAYSSEPDNPDFAFNLAVSLDHLRQFKLARQYYERAVGLAAKRGASFDVAAARTRIQQLPE